MKNVLWFSVLILLISCNDESDKKKDMEITDKVSQVQAVVYSRKNHKLPKDYITTKTFYKEENTLILNYKYPYLNEEGNSSYQNFNTFIEDVYVNRVDTVEKILENNALSCDPLFKEATRIKRGIDYKVYNSNDQFLSILLYKTNYYDHKNHNSFMFKGINYDVQRGTFITYQDVFKNNSEEFLLFKLNQELEARISAQDSFKDCWKFTEDSFESFKNNFVIGKEHIKFYFDDCVVCPIYSGNYFLEIPLEELSLVFRTEVQQNFFATTLFPDYK